MIIIWHLFHLYTNPIHDPIKHIKAPQTSVALHKSYTQLTPHVYIIIIARTLSLYAIYLSTHRLEIDNVPPFVGSLRAHVRASDYYFLIKRTKSAAAAARLPIRLMKAAAGPPPRVLGPVPVGAARRYTYTSIIVYIQKRTWPTMAKCTNKRLCQAKGMLYACAQSNISLRDDISAL